MSRPAQPVVAAAGIATPVLTGLVVAPNFYVRQTAEGRLVAGFDFAGAFVGTPANVTERLIRRLNEVFALPEPARFSP